MAAIFAILGKNPITSLGVYFLDPLTDSYSLEEIAVKATPLVMIAVGLSLCYIANIWNIGAEGQFLIGRCGARWRDCPTDYGPYTTIYNRFNRWSQQGIWTDIFYALTGSTGRIGTMSIDSTHIKAHRSAAGAKGGTSNRRSAARGAGAPPKSTR